MRLCYHLEWSEFPSSGNMKNKLILLVGCSGSGKSTFAKTYLDANQNVKYLSSDKLRAVFGKSESDQSVTFQVFDAIKSMVNEYLKNGDDVMVDATSLNIKERKDYLNTAKTYNVETTAIVFERSKQQLMENQQKRGASGGRVVPEFVIDKMLSKYVRPSKEEGFSEIRLM